MAINLNPLTCKTSLGSGAFAGKLKALKGSFSSGLSGITSAVDGVLGGLQKALSPAAFQSFSAEFLKLDRLNTGAVAKFKAKWGKAVTGLDEMMGNLETFDICTILEKGDVKMDGDGNEIMTAPPLAVAETAPLPIVPAPPTAMTNAADYRSDTAAALDITAADGKVMEKAWLEQVKILVKDPAKLLQESLDSVKKDLGQYVKENSEAEKIYVAWNAEGREAAPNAKVREFTDLLEFYLGSIERLRAQIKLLNTWADQIQLTLRAAARPYEDFYKKDLLMKDFFSPADRAQILRKITTTPGKLILNPSYYVSLKNSDYEIIKSLNDTAGFQLWNHRDLYLGYLIGTTVIH